MKSLKDTIFCRTRLNSKQMKQVADRRREDAKYLFNSGQNQYYNASVYLYGIAVECLLKGLLLECEPWLANVSQSKVSASRDKRQQRLYYLMYRDHFLDGLLESMPQIRKEIELSKKTWMDFAKVSEWSIFIRYSPRQVPRGDALTFQSSAEEVFKWLRQK